MHWQCNIRISNESMDAILKKFNVFIGVLLSDKNQMLFLVQYGIK